MVTENPRKWPIFIILFGGAFVLLLVLVTWRWGSQGLFTIVKWFLFLGFVLAIFSLIILAIFWLFKRHKKEMVYIMRNSIIQTCKINANGYPQELWLKGDKPLSYRRIGKVVGFAMVKSAIKKMKDPNTQALVELEKPKDVIFCTFNNGGLIAKILGFYNVFAGVYADDFANDLTVPQVFINDHGIGLAP